MLITVSSGSYTLLDSGVVVAEGNKPVRFAVQDIYFEIRFLDDDLEDRTETEVSEDGKGLVLRMYNVSQSLGGSGFHDIRSIATVDGVQIYLSFDARFVKHPTKKIRHVTYSLYKGEVVGE
ncbi:hypothetical protein M5224_004713 [Vibrio parahaemolyticus]|uniref:DUF6864 domain-containing function n=1 Tax=Vibrio parahaemolyticus TaxID=670 RepID=UPI0006A74A8D|nr:hypothetical protein [Vibrio parahaemolyticus]EHK9101505.1 hypothetical protein [Vibrio parahaemolyticus]EIT7136883.1 hypothetical protein [Vibrio parahaemolyticus]EIU6794256.1 hypothetical protein [Vibrio parahaemolyticus]EIV8632265.1 hypothetical protein [Vibrio parahaemolyticus]EIZ1178906.1 hypothetical protein [Vibrio parahaemolyticus]